MKKIILSVEAELLDLLMILSVPFCLYNFVLEPIKHQPIKERQYEPKILITTA